MTKRIKNKVIRKIVENLLSFQYLIFKKEISLDYNTKVLISENPYPNLLSEVNSKSISNKIEQKKDKRYYEWRLSDPNRSNKFIYSYLFMLIKYLSKQIFKLNYMFESEVIHTQCLMKTYFVVHAQRWMSCDYFI